MTATTFSACVELHPPGDTAENASTRELPSSGFFGTYSPERPSAGGRPSAVTSVPKRVVAVSPAMRHVQNLLEILARAEVTVTLTGPTGTGKDVLARTIHRQSDRAEEPFVVFDCGAVALNLAESELFGHERGAFTGAVAARAGAFERANGGTLFLDEIGELPLELQTRLLRVLGNGCVRRVGGTHERPVDVRIVAATNRDLKEEVSAGAFREDLYFRLAAAVIYVPALAERREDLPLLAAGLLEDLGFPNVRVSTEALEVLTRREWRGNVRELKNTLTCALAFLDGETIEPRHLAFVAGCESRCELQQLSLAGQKLEAIERVAIAQTLEQTRGNKAKAAEILGVATSTLYAKLKKYQLRAC
jgi:two-component system, NtrC family, response regulator HydG